MAEIPDRRDFVLSIRPEYAKLIIGGEKTVELRRRFANRVGPGAIALIYCTSPTQAIIGMTEILDIECLPIGRLWSKHGKAAKVRPDTFSSYFAGCNKGFALLLGKPRKFERALSASKLRKQFGFVPPQSFVYLPMRYYALLENERLQAPY